MKLNNGHVKNKYYNFSVIQNGSDVMKNLISYNLAINFIEAILNTKYAKVLI